MLGISGDCIASYPGDFAQALIALDAQVEVSGRNGARVIPFAELHRAPGSTPHLEHTLAPGDLIIAFEVPATPFARRSLYLKIRDRESYEFALASAAVALDLDGDTVEGRAHRARRRRHRAVARRRRPKPSSRGQTLDEDTLAAAADAAFAAGDPARTATDSRSSSASARWSAPAAASRRVGDLT